jgi:predicted transcriptional regulator
MESTTVTLRTPIGIVAKLDEEARRRKRSRNYIVNELLEQHYSNGHQEPEPIAAKKKKAGPR